MAFLSRIHRAQHDVAGVQSALASVQTGLDVVETAAELVDDVRRGFRRRAKFGVLILVVVGVIVVILMSRRSEPATDET